MLRICDSILPSVLYLEWMSLVCLLDGGDESFESDIRESGNEEEKRRVSEDGNDREVSERDEKGQRHAQSHRRVNRFAPVEQIHRRWRDVAQEAGGEGK